MISFFPDVNVWLALSVAGHSHGEEAWIWLRSLPTGSKLAYCRYTQLGLLRLLANEAVMGGRTLTMRESWSVYDRWLRDPRVEFLPEPALTDAALREATAPFAARRAAKWVGDCYLLAFARASGASLATFDQALYRLARRQGHAAVVPA